MAAVVSGRSEDEVKDGSRETPSEAAAAEPEWRMLETKGASLAEEKRREGARMRVTTTIKGRARKKRQRRRTGNSARIRSIYL
jgi:hypothetical protein